MREEFYDSEEESEEENEEETKIIIWKKLLNRMNA